MSWNDDERFNLTTFGGHKDRTEARKVQDLIAPMSIRTRVVENADGSQSIHRMRAGWPTVMTTEVPANKDEDTVYLRGYVSNIKSRTMATLGTAWAYIIRRSASVWKKHKQFLKFGTYAVDTIASTEPDVWVNRESTDGHELVIYRKDATLKRKITGRNDGVPIILQSSAGTKYATGVTDTSDTHLFIAGKSYLAHSTWRENNPLAEVFNRNELASDTAAYPKVDESGVTYRQSADTFVSYTTAFLSNAGNILQRSMLLKLLNVPPYVNRETYVDQAVTGVAYIFPGGSPTSEALTGQWLNPIAPVDSLICQVYEKTGGPYPATGEYNFVTWLEGSPAVDPTGSSTTVYDYNGSDGYSWNIPVGWFGGDLAAEVSASTSAIWHKEASSGIMRVVNPATIVYSGYGSTNYAADVTYQWITGQDNTLPAGTLVGEASSGSTDYRTWSSSSQASCAIDGMTILSMTYTRSGSSQSWTGETRLRKQVFPYQGSPVNFADPNGNAYAASWDAVLRCNTRGDADQYSSSSFLDTVPTSGGSTSTTQTFAAETRDYILFDRVAQRYVYLKGEFQGGDSSSRIALKIVVQYGDTLMEKTLRDVTKDSFSFMPYIEQVYQDVYFWNPPVPFTGFAPPFCIQGNCPYVAYSEAVDIGEPVFLMSLPLVIQMNDESPPAPAASYLFNPRNFKGVFGLATLPMVTDFWSGFSNEVQVVNFADGQFNDWVGGVYEQANQDSSTYSEIYRT